MTPVPLTPATAPPEPPPPAVPRSRVRRWWSGVVVGLLVGALLIWYGVLLLSNAAPAAVTGGPASFVPDDGSRFPATFTQADSEGPAMVENARLHGVDITFAMSATAATFIDLPQEGLDRAEWWREAVVPDDQRQPSRYRIRSFDTDGIWLRAQDWQALGITFEDLLELPVDVAAGRTWTSTGAALAAPSSVQLTYRNTSTARPPTDPDRAAAGCVAVSSTTALMGGSTPLTWSEDTLWCPGAGAVVSEGSFRGTSYRLEPLAAAPPLTDDPLTAAAASSDVSTRQARPESLLDGDATFGGQAAQLTPGLAPKIAGNGVVALVPAAGDSLTGLLPTTPGTLWWHWWTRPGGNITSVATVGRLVAVTTTRRELVVYEAGGRWLWSRDLDDVAVAPPLELPDSRIAVATVGGTVAVYDARTGAESWQQRLTYGVFNPLATDGRVLAVADAGPHVTAFDLGSGRQLWQNDAGSPFGTSLAVAAGSVAVVGSGAVRAYEVLAGRQRWYRTVGLGLGQVVPHGDQLWIESGSGRVESWGLADGRTRWIGAGLRTAPASRCRLTDGPGGSSVFLAFRGTELVAVDDGGRVRQSWPLRGSADELRSADCGAGRIWVTGYGSGGGADLHVESVGPA